MKYGTGYGANRADFERGYLEVSSTEKPEQDLADYRARWTMPKGGYSINYDFEMKNCETKGFLTRPNR